MSSNRVQSYGVNSSNGGGGRQVSFDVRLPDSTPSRDEIARAVFRHFGFTEQDDEFLRRRVGVDPVRYFADTLRFNPRSVTTDARDATSIRISLSDSDFQLLTALASERRQQTQCVAPTNVAPAEALAARDGYDRTNATRQALLNQTTTTNGATNHASEEGFGSFVEGALAGDFSDNDSWSRTGGQMVVGLIPVVGQLADARDTAAALRDVWQGKEGAWAMLGAAAVGWIPLVGDGAKAAFRVGRRAMAEGAEEVIERGTREVITEGTQTGLRVAEDQIDEAERYGVSFFGGRVVPYMDRPGATLGRQGEAHFFMPLEDAAVVRTTGDAARASGHAPSVVDAYVNGGSVYGLSFPTTGLPVRVPTVQDSGGWPHFLEGGHTAVRTADPNGGYLVNSTRELVTPGGNPVPRGSVLFELNSDGSWRPMRRF